ncbi:amino acid/amide ABC transporter substrate-binding protein, HAAT family (TC 3.A.1.4.-) [Formivibrio citricus]|uniref:Amino acid/amide ABC transporter substrate-binding protein, HAAT family (TC 3.A.1.4.-) n=1 Tax=Formivibrio citricus TaxID=83765 RepID=A0A1I5CVH4_9NEIS|nr:ABC transporter substrate-binding protein [Formivibrio citricus]SFN90959.1 amino acid/amide ABC transporter substrate-binding protein, HAAT family (TC 3.A.1.4.-) [Formivibrio citricus]
MKKRFSLLTLAAMMAAGISLVGCSGSGSTDKNVIKIGVFQPLTGANGAGGAAEYEGTKLANKLFPEVLGKKIQLVVVDNKSDKVEAANAATVLAQKEKVNAVIGSWGSSLSMSGGPIFAEAKIPAVAVSATNPNVTKGNEFYFRVCFLDPFQGTVGAAYAFNTLKAKKVAIIREVSNDYSVGLAKFFVDEFVKLSGNKNAIVATADYNTGDQDFSAQLTNLKQFEPDVIFAPGNYTESALIIKQARALGIKAQFIGGDTWDESSFLTVGGSAVEGAVFSTFFANDKPINKTSEAFLKAYREEFKKEPAAGSALGYDAYLVILDAIKRANSAEPQKIRDALAKTKGFEGSAGEITINAERNADKAAVFKTVKDGKFVFLTTVKP